MQEYLSPYILDHNFDYCFSPVLTMQYLLGSSRVEIRDLFVTLPSTNQKRYTLFSMILVTVSFIHFGYNHYISYYNVSTFMYLTATLGATVQYLSYMFNIVQVRFRTDTDNVRMYLLLQNIERLLKVFQIPQLKCHIFSLAYFAVYLVGISSFLESIIFLYSALPVIPLLGIFLVCGIISVYIDIILVALLILYLVQLLTFLVDVIKCRMMRTTMHHHHTNKNLLIFGLRQNYYEEHLLSMVNCSRFSQDDIFNCLHYILSAYKLVGKLFKFQIFALLANVFLWCFFLLSTIIEGLKLEVFSRVASLILCSYMFAYFVLVCVLVYLYSNFEKKTYELQNVCIDLLSTTSEGQTNRKTAKRTLSMIEGQRLTMSVYGIFTLDLGLPIRLLGLITTYTALIMQFSLAARQLNNN